MSVPTPPPFHFIPVISFSHHWTEAPSIFCFWILGFFLALGCGAQHWEILLCLALASGPSLCLLSPDPSWSPRNQELPVLWLPWHRWGKEDLAQLSLLPRDFSLVSSFLREELWMTVSLSLKTALQIEVSFLEKWGHSSLNLFPEFPGQWVKKRKDNN